VIGQHCSISQVASLDPIQNVHISVPARRSCLSMSSDVSLHDTVETLPVPQPFIGYLLKLRIALLMLSLQLFLALFLYP